MTLKEGQKVKLSEFKQKFIVRAANDRFAILTKPFNPRNTVLYTILDFKKGLRNRDNLVFGFGYEQDEDCKEALKMLDSGEMEISDRGPVKISIDSVE